jgi:(S)-ureidoglycine aminohydrolase
MTMKRIRCWLDHNASHTLYNSMGKVLFVIFFLSPLFIFAQRDSIPSGMYSWKKPVQKTQKNILTTICFEGSAHDMKFLQMTANTLVPSKEKCKLQVSDGEEHLMLMKTGTLTISIKDSSWSISAGSIALLMPGEKYTLQNTNGDSCNYYLMKYSSKLPMNTTRGKTSGGSFVKDWNKIEFRPHDRGGIRNYFERPTSMCKRLEMHVTTLKEGIKSHEPHKHRAEEIVLVIDNKTEMQIADKFYKGSAGDVYYLGSNVSHAIRNDGKGPCVYFAFQFE